MERKWREARQRPYQTVKEFVSYLEGIAPYIEGLSNEKKATHLLLGLKRSIYDVIVIQPGFSNDYEKLQRLAERIEMTQLGKSNASRSDQGSDTGKSMQNRSRASLPKNPTKPQYQDSTDANSTPLGKGGKGSPQREDDDNPHRKKRRRLNEDYPTRSARLADIECWNCHKMGHYAPDYPDKTDPKNGRV
jgi:hypothetical protein